MQDVVGVVFGFYGGGNGGGGGGGGTVTSVGLALPVSVFAVSGSPVTTSGTLTGTFVTQTANKVFAGPTSGGAAVPTFRALQGLDYSIVVNVTPVLSGNNGRVSYNDNNIYQENNGLFFNPTFNTSGGGLTVGTAAAGAILSPNYALTLSGDKGYNAGASFNSVGYTNSWTGVSFGTSDWNLGSTTVGIIQPGTPISGGASHVGVLQIAGFASANAAGLQLWGLTTTTTAAGGIALKAGLLSTGPAAVSDIPSNQHFLTFKNIVANSGNNILSNMNGAGQWYFGGTLGTIATANVQIFPGTATASTAPLKFIGGTLLTTPEAGAIENDGTHLYWTSDAAIRFQLDQQLIPFKQTISSGQAATLQTVPVDIADLPAPGAGYAWEIMSMSVSYIFNTTDYDFTTIGVFTDTALSNSPQFKNDYPMGALGANSWTVGAISTSNKTVIIENKKMQITSDVEPTVGDGTFVVYGTARKITI